jgi:hypothetical protein
VFKHTPFFKGQKMNRETWLEKFTDQFLLDHFKNAGFEITSELREKLKFSCSLTSGRGSKNARAIGLHFDPKASKGAFHEIMISPTIEESSRVADILIHEIVHAVVGNQAGHGKAFKRCAVAVGLTGKMTATIASETLKLKLDNWIDSFGAYPHRELILSGKKQSTRLIKAECYCGYNVRMSRKWLHEIGAPICPACEIQMHVAGDSDEEEGE